VSVTGSFKSKIYDKLLAVSARQALTKATIVAAPARRVLLILPVFEKKWSWNRRLEVGQDLQ